jgi:hypothetical protein
MTLHAPTIKHYLTRVTVALVAIGALGLGNLSKPAMATPTNTEFDRVVSGCTYDFEYGTVFGAAYAKVKVVGADPSGLDCEMLIVKDYWARSDGSSGADDNERIPIGSAWNDQNTWHSVVTNYATGYGAEWVIDVNHPSCLDFWTLDARFNDGHPEGYWTNHDNRC